MYNINAYADLLQIPNEFLDNPLAPYTVKLSLYGSAGRETYPHATIRLGGKVLHDGTINENVSLQWTITPNKKRQLLTIELDNKSDSDTVIADGVIVRDKFVRVESISIDDVELDLFTYYRYRPTYSAGFLEIVKDAPRVVNTNLINFNGKFGVYYECPALTYIARKRYTSGHYFKAKALVTADSFVKLAEVYKKII